MFKITKIIFLLTVHNRVSKTKKFLTQILNSNLSSKFIFKFVIVDDGSVDETYQYLKNLNEPRISLLRGSGNLFWSGGMKFGFEKIVKHSDYHYLICCNNDITLNMKIFNEYLESMKRHQVLIGQFKNYRNEIVYGGLKKRFLLPFAFKVSDQRVDSFNMNFVSIKKNIIDKFGFFSDSYVHSKSDIDYGLKLKKKGINLQVFSKVIGNCEKNSFIESVGYRKINFKQFISEPKFHPLRERLEFCFKYYKFSCIFCIIHPYLVFLIKKLK